MLRRCRPSDSPFGFASRLLAFGSQEPHPEHPVTRPQFKSLDRGMEDCQLPLNREVLSDQGGTAGEDGSKDRKQSSLCVSPVGKVVSSRTCRYHACHGPMAPENPIIPP